MANVGGSSVLNNSVLVLNRSYIVIHVVGVRRAFCLLTCETVEVIDLKDGSVANHNFESWRAMSELRTKNKHPNEDWLRAVDFEIQVPRVIRLLMYDKVPKFPLRLTRRGVFIRDEHRCQYCSRHFVPGQLSLDHVIPRSHGGKTTWENVVCACRKCNVKKGGRTPRGARMKLIRKPFRPKQNPMLRVRLDNPKYESWKMWLNEKHYVGDRSQTPPIACSRSETLL